MCVVFKSIEQRRDEAVNIWDDVRDYEALVE